MLCVVCLCMCVYIVVFNVFSLFLLQCVFGCIYKHRKPSIKCFVVLYDAVDVYILFVYAVCVLCLFYRIVLFMLFSLYVFVFIVYTNTSKKPKTRHTFHCCIDCGVFFIFYKCVWLLFVCVFLLFWCLYCLFS